MCLLLKTKIGGNKCATPTTMGLGPAGSRALQKKMYIMGPGLQAPVTKKNKKCRQVRTCNLMGRSLQAPVSLPLACSENGYLCSLAKDCDTCIDKGCGWCASEEYEGKAGGGMYVCMYKGTCMEGNVWGALCGDCGSNCSCSW